MDDPEPTRSAGFGTRLRRLVTHDVETGRSRAYPGLEPLDLGLPPDRAFDLAVAAAREMERWTITGLTPERGRLEAEARTLILRFVDDVTVRVESRDEGSRVRVRSTSRVGIYDFGTNARRIRTYLDRVRAKAAAVNHH